MTTLTDPKMLTGRYKRLLPPSPLLAACLYTLRQLPTEYLPLLRELPPLLLRSLPDSEKKREWWLHDGFINTDYRGFCAVIGADLRGYQCA